MMNNQTKIVSFQKLFIKTLKTSTTNFFHSCPYVGNHSILNASSPMDVVQIVPVGIFRVTFKAFDKVDRKILFISLHANVF